MPYYQLLPAHGSGARFPMDLQTAVHEAGHAVVAMFVGRPVISVAMDADGRNGLCTASPAPHWTGYVATCLAGICSTVLHLGDVGEEGSETDCRHIAAKIEKHAGPEERRHLVERIWSETERTLALPECVRAVQAIADKLLDTGSLDAEQVRRLFVANGVVGFVGGFDVLRRGQALGKYRGPDELEPLRREAIEFVLRAGGIDGWRLV